MAPDAKKAKVAEPDAPAQSVVSEVTPETEAEAKEGLDAAAAAVADVPMIVEDAATAAAPATAVTQEAAAPTAIVKPETPITIGFKTFTGGAECLDYYHHLLGTLTKNQDLNEVPSLFQMHSNPQALHLLVVPCIFQTHVSSAAICHPMAAPNDSGCVLNSTC